ncbi:MAG: GntR family transcriptional regulator, transcriptional repressor for pyruvate dehydrogenase complex [Solirubrobacteraceae bacterium]|jgi:DNA-binding FadR family transcriptional regulator|nr:GntR family transcriptional regulator, transcriptional repressor for pyruvate dehydrogenase complex [Solirubrobacteraceae bacterium]
MAGTLSSGAAAARRPSRTAPGSTPSQSVASKLEPIDQLRSHEYVAAQLRRQIGLRLVLPTQALPSERELSALFGVGRATVQAGIRLLEAERLVETRRGRNGGTFVLGHAEDDLAKDYLLARLRQDRDRIREALVFRRNVETFAARLAATRRRVGELDEIRGAHVAAASAQSDAEFVASDTQLHLAIARAARNVFVYEALEHMRLVLNDAIVALPAETKPLQQRAVKEHAVILEAIVSRDPEAASTATARHAASTEKGIAAMLAKL